MHGRQQVARTNSSSSSSNGSGLNNVSRSNSNSNSSNSQMSRNGSLGGVNASPTQSARPTMGRMVSHQSAFPYTSQHNTASLGASRKKSLSKARKSSEVDMLDGIVDMEAFSQILVLDETDSSREFSKALVWAWCDQAEHAVEEMENFLVSGDVTSLASKAHYLKGSSASLGLIHVSQTCQSIYHIHFPPSLAQFRSYSYQSEYSGSSSSSGSSFSGPSGGSGSGSPNVAHRGSIASMPSPDLSNLSTGPFDFDGDKLMRAQKGLNKLKSEIKEASEWLYTYYQEADKYAASMN